VKKWETIFRGLPSFLACFMFEDKLRDVIYSGYFEIPEAGHASATT
jgi:hypothetical protein